MFSCKAALLLMCACVCLATDKICLPHQFCEADVNDPMVQKLASYIVEYVSTHIDGGHYVLKEVLSAQEQREEQQKNFQLSLKALGDVAGLKVLNATLSVAGPDDKISNVKITQL